MSMAEDPADNPEVGYQVTNHVATITLNRPKAQNTISGPMLQALSARLVEANEDADVRAIVLTGSGRFFCAGLDLRGGGIASGLSDKRVAPATLDLRNTPPTDLQKSRSSRTISRRSTQLVQRRPARGCSPPRPCSRTARTRRSKGTCTGS
jgi:hypothetical protein